MLSVSLRVAGRTAFPTSRVSRALHSIPMASVDTSVMSRDERYLFDLNGFLIVKQVFNQCEVLTANAAIDKYDHNLDWNEPSLI